MRDLKVNDRRLDEILELNEARQSDGIGAAHFCNDAQMLAYDRDLPRIIVELRALRAEVERMRPVSGATTMSDDADELARSWLDREGRMHDVAGRVVHVNLRDAGLEASLAALLRNTTAALRAEVERMRPVVEAAEKFGEMRRLYRENEGDPERFDVAIAAGDAFDAAVATYHKGETDAKA